MRKDNKCVQGYAHKNGKCAQGYAIKKTKNHLPPPTKLCNTKEIAMADYRKITYPSSVYEGEALDSTPHGVGKMTYQNGDQYHGEFRHGKRCGLGEMKFIDGRLLRGRFKSDKLIG